MTDTSNYGDRITVTVHLIDAPLPPVIAPFGGAEEMVKDLKAKVFAEREMKFLAVGANGKEVRVL